MKKASLPPSRRLWFAKREGIPYTDLAMDEKVRRRSVRLEDIAQQVGVSRSEVSRVLNGQTRAGRNVGQAKQEEIQKVARELGYQPNHAARNLALGRTDTVGLTIKVGPDHELSPHYHEIVGALTHALGEWGLQLLLVQWNASHLESLSAVARTHSCDMIILTDLRGDDPRPALLTKHGQAFAIRGSAPQPGVMAVGMDNRAVGKLALEYLAGLGHKSILFQNIGRDLMSGEGRYQGMREAQQALAPDVQVHYEDRFWGEEGLYALTRTAFAQANPPTALFVADELAALGVLRALNDLGKRIPEDVSVLTCLNARFMRRVIPQLSVIHVRQHEVAAELGRTIGRLLRGEAVEATQTFLAPVFEDRGSCAPPRLQ